MRKPVGYYLICFFLFHLFCFLLSAFLLLSEIFLISAFPCFIICCPVKYFPGFHGRFFFWYFFLLFCSCDPDFFLHAGDAVRILITRLYGFGFLCGIFFCR